ncbi:MAG: putative ABC transporter permease [Anaeroplasmataceae bacterium]|nr:putative ABC transporter permease [Anaeroplasmataceae bacterium]MDE6240813.1 putative ABC transporter permease [Anaeroplasmataceae bacterium]
MNVEQYIFCFFVYAFLGYLCEVAYCSICQRKLVNRGYLYMPICPIYGCGAILILLSMLPISNMWYLVLILGILLTSGLEYLTSYVMELIFHMRWWDYSKRKLNINGRVCLRNSLMFGALVMLVIYGLHPLVSKLMEAMGTIPIRVLNSIFLTGLIVDFIFSTIKNINIAKVVAKINQFTEEATDKLKELKASASEKFSETKEYLSNTAIALKLKELISKYPNVSLRKVGKGKKRLSISEFIAKHLNDKDEK